MATLPLAPLQLHGYWRSSAAYRVRIALNLKGLAYTQVAHDLRAGAQGEPAYKALALTASFRRCRSATR